LLPYLVRKQMKIKQYRQSRHRSTHLCRATLVSPQSCVTPHTFRRIHVSRHTLITAPTCRATHVRPHFCVAPQMYRRINLSRHLSIAPFMCRSTHVWRRSCVEPHTFRRIHVSSHDGRLEGIHFRKHSVGYLRVNHTKQSKIFYR
jgi:hypothetical protein